MPRTHIHEALAEYLATNLKKQNFDDETIAATIARWNAGEEAVGPIELGLFSVFDTVLEQIDKQDPGDA